MKIYISGKMRGLPEEESRKLFKAAEQYLKTLGHDVINPWDSEKEKEERCLEWDDYILYDLRIIKHCDALFMLDNWQDSDGAKCEHAFARGRGMKIFYEKKKSPINESLVDAPDKIFLQSNGKEYSTWADEEYQQKHPRIDDVEYIRKERIERIIRGATGPQDALRKLNLV